MVNPPLRCSQRVLLGILLRCKFVFTLYRVKLGWTRLIVKYNRFPSPEVCISIYPGAIGDWSVSVFFFWHDRPPGARYIQSAEERQGAPATGAVRLRI